MRLFCALLVVVFSTICSGQTTTTTGKAGTTGPCSPAGRGKNNTFEIHCNINTAQGKQMVEILNKILQNQIASKDVMEKLEEILNAVNPNRPVVSYACDGTYRSVGPSATAVMAIIAGGDTKAFQHMVELNNSGQYPELFVFCKAQTAANPSWLTPLLFCSVSYFAMGDQQNAAAMLKEYDSKTGPAYDVDGCKQLSDALHQKIAP